MTAYRGKGKRNDLAALQIGERGKKASEVWSLPLPDTTQMEALALAGQTLVAAGPVDRIRRKKGRIWAVSAETGKKTAEWALDTPPVYDGLAAAGGRLYVATRTGSLLCLGSKP